MVRYTDSIAKPSATTEYNDFKRWVATFEMLRSNAAVPFQSKPKERDAGGLLGLHLDEA